MVLQPLQMQLQEAACLDAVKAALHWLSNLEHRWLLIIDNADDENIALPNYFPKGNRKFSP